MNTKKMLRSQALLCAFFPHLIAHQWAQGYILTIGTDRSGPKSGVSKTANSSRKHWQGYVVPYIAYSVEQCCNVKGSAERSTGQSELSWVCLLCRKARRCKTFYVSKHLVKASLCCRLKADGMGCCWIQVFTLWVIDYLKLPNSTNFLAENRTCNK